MVKGEQGMKKLILPINDSKDLNENKCSLRILLKLWKKFNQIILNQIGIILIYLYIKKNIFVFYAFLKQFYIFNRD